MGCEEFVGWNFRARFGKAGFNLPYRERYERRLRMRPLGCGYGAAIVLVAAAVAANGALIRV